MSLTSLSSSAGGITTLSVAKPFLSSLEFMITTPFSSATRARNMERWFDDLKARARTAEEVNREAAVKDVYAYFENTFRLFLFNGSDKQFEGFVAQYRFAAKGSVFP